MESAKLIRLLIVSLILSLSFLSDASALTLSAKCQVSATRSRISVVAAGLNGVFRVTALSGDVHKTTIAKRTNVQNFVTFIFDSNPTAINAGGVTPITAGYIKGNFVIVRLRDALTGRLLGAVGPTCTAFN